MKQIVQQLRGQCASKLEDQMNDYKEQIERCSQGFDSTDDKLQETIDGKLKCEKKLVE